MIHLERIQKLNNLSINKKGSFVLYWMQSSHRTQQNHALEFAIENSNDLNIPLVIYFGLSDSFPEANIRHFNFLLEGLQEVEATLRKRNIKFVIQRISPEIGAEKLAKEAALVVVDKGYLKTENKWYRYLSGKLDCSLIQIESNIVVPVEEASDKEEFAAYTIRPKITKKLHEYLVPTGNRKIKLSSLDFDFSSLNLQDIEKILNESKIDKSVSSITGFTGGYSNARNNLQLFISEKLDQYEIMRNNPVYDYQSNLSPYLHFGQISPLEVALEISKSKSKAKDDFLEQLIIRRELSINFVHYNSGYDNYKTINQPRWAEQTLEEHVKDKREYLYSIEEFEQAKTHDSYWNAAQKEMVITGKMHNYMRMYWVKKILEWTETPEQAYNIAIYLNNKYELDGRDPNGYTGVAWCFGKHDRPWKERPIFGKVRYMNANGLKRKFDAEKYVLKIKEIEENL